MKNKTRSCSLDVAEKLLGQVKADETPEEACVRETKEETGLDIQIKSSISTINNNNYFKCCLTDKPQEIHLQLNECDEFVWISPSKILDVGIVMDLKIIYSVLKSVGYEIELNEEAKQICVD